MTPSNKKNGSQDGSGPPEDGGRGPDSREALQQRIQEAQGDPEKASELLQQTVLETIEEVRRRKRPGGDG